MQVKKTDAYETDQSALILARMTWENWTVLSRSIELGYVELDTGHLLINDDIQPEISEVGKTLEHAVRVRICFSVLLPFSTPLPAFLFLFFQ